ncbi:methyltransferase RsmF C-terminal domain-like protein [Candidatus Avelusimicrobium luingense]|uniref:methyltransferase RsmF C-terminal domain-like protein n=1 Tax=Candidatus Avelusimicrobium luingense TaxID=3416211 RepID=UPI003D13FF26
MLPQEFTDYTSALFGPERWQRFLQAFEQETPVSVRFNPFKYHGEPVFESATAVPWCKDGYWLNERPNFTLDPLFHAGVYYVQEAGSLFLDQVLRQYVSSPVLALDLCGAPGGKSTLMRAALPQGSMLVTNEPDRRRANILLENMLKQGHPDVLVTHNQPYDFTKTKWTFDIILTDVPCSGEGLFRRDSNAVSEWSMDNVRYCQKRQRQILQDIWPCLRPGGLLIYSTCTFNTQENEENIRFIAEELGAEILPVAVDSAWQITGSLLENWAKPVYRFIPGVTKSEGLFMAILRKNGVPYSPALLPASARKHAQSNPLIHLLSDGLAAPEQKGKELIPSAAQALSLNLSMQYPRVELSLELARRYLHRESLVLPPDTPKGFVAVTYRGYALGFMKNLGERANNLYPKNWAIRNLQI